jgi:hypothetical protein
MRAETWPVNSGGIAVAAQVGEKMLKFRASTIQDPSPAAVRDRTSVLAWGTWLEIILECQDLPQALLHRN